jgi:hypothetical protein
MGTFKITIIAVGGHGVDRSKKDGEVVDFSEGGDSSPDALAKKLVEALRASGCSFDYPDHGATITHWPGQESEVNDDLLTGVRKGNF